jgi:hypothetical protein
MDMAPYRPWIRRVQDGYGPISIVRTATPFTGPRRPRWIWPHIDRSYGAPFPGSGESMMDMPAYRSSVRRVHSRVRRSQDGYALISIVGPPSPRWISPHIDRPYGESVHGSAEAAMDMAPYRSFVRRPLSRVRRVHDGYARISIVRTANPFTGPARPRWICPHIDRRFAEATTDLRNVDRSLHVTVVREREAAFIGPRACRRGDRGPRAAPDRRGRPRSARGRSGDRPRSPGRGCADRGGCWSLRDSRRAARRDRG